MTARPSVVRAAVGTLLAALTLTLVPWSPAAAEPERPEPGSPWFGPALLYPGDTPAAYVDRLGETPAMYTLPVPFPLDSGAVSQLRQFSALIAEQGAVLLLDVQPGDDLRLVDESAATELAEELGGVHEELGLRVLVRFAPEMNGTWEPWGQQPGAYVRAFRTVADEVHAVDAGSSWASMVWAPVYGSGYPFRNPRRTQGALDDVIARDRARLDTDGDGRVAIGDDPYSPYFPGEEYVDWVGLSMYRLGQAQGARRNTVPPPDEFERRLAETWGYPEDRGGEPFYDRYAVGLDLPMLVETAAFYNPAYAGPSERRVKSAWWRQVFAAMEDHPQIAGISWLDVDRSEPEALQDEPVDWRVTHRPRLASAFRQALLDSTLTLGPVTERVVAEEPEDEPITPGDDTDGADARPDAAARPALPTADGLDSSWWVLGLAAALLLGMAAGWAVPRWRSPVAAARDERLDLARGALLLGLVGTFVAVAGTGVAAGVDPWALTAGAGLLLLVSGAAHGVRSREVAGRLGGWASGVTRVRRARTVYVAALAAAGLALLLENTPGVASPLGEYEYPRALLGYPPPADAVGDLATLAAAPWLVGTLGLVVLLVLASPLFLGLARTRLWPLALALSWGLYAAWVGFEPDPLPLPFDAALPLLAWQLPFVHGLVLGHRRGELTVLARRGWPVALVAALLATYAALMVAESLPEHDPPMPVVVGVSALGLIGLLTGLGRPLRVLLGWLLTPVGRVPLLAVPVTVAATLGAAELDLTTDAQRWAVVGASVAALWLLAGAVHLVRARGADAA